MTASDEGLLDASVVVLLERITDLVMLPVRPVISSVTLAELSVGPMTTADPAQRAIPPVAPAAGGS